MFAKIHTEGFYLLNNPNTFIKIDKKEDIKDKGVDESKEDKNGKIIKSSITELKASEEAKEVVNQALDNGIQQVTDVPATATANEPSLYERYKKAFSIEGFNVS